MMVPKATGRSLEDLIAFAAKRRNREFIYQLSDQEVLPDSIGDLKHVESVDFSHCGLRRLPPSFSKLESLRLLYLDRNLLGDLPPSVRGCRNLKVLSVKWNGIQVLPDWIGELPTLEMFLVGGNPAVVLPEVRFPATLKVLDLSENASTTFHASLDRVESLRCLRLLRSKFEALPDSGGAYVDLEVLDAEGSQLKALPGSLARGRALRVLCLAGTHVSALPNDLASSGTLDTLDLRHSRIPVESIPWAFELPKLSRLDLGGLCCAGPPVAVWRMRSLRFLGVSGIQLFRPDAIPEIGAPLVAIDLSGSAIDRKTDLARLAHLKDLRWLNLAGTALAAREPKFQDPVRAAELIRRS